MLLANDDWIVNFASEFSDAKFFCLIKNEFGWWEHALIERLEEESIQLREILLQLTKNLVKAHDAFAVFSRRISKTGEEWTFESNRKIE